MGAVIRVPTLVEPHAHLDKAFLADRVPNPRGDLPGAIEAMTAARASIDVADTAARAERAARLMADHGVSAIRTHADVTRWNGLISLEALVGVRDRLAELVTIQVVALAGFPITGPDGAAQRTLLAEAMDAGADLVGGCPHLDPDPAAAIELFLETADRYGVAVDLHVDENLDPTSADLELLARRVLHSGFARPVTASHAVALGMRPPGEQQRIAELVAEAGIGVVALPATNLYLQGRDRPQATPRGLTAIAALRAAAVPVAAGGDNLRDPFHPLGNGDPLETAALLVLTAHLLPDEALAAVTTTARTVLGLANDGRVVECAADTVGELLARRPLPRRIVDAP